MIPSLISLLISPYTPQGVYCEIYPSLEGNIERIKSQYSLFQNDILFHTDQLCFNVVILANYYIFLFSPGLCPRDFLIIVFTNNFVEKYTKMSKYSKNLNSVDWYLVQQLAWGVLLIQELIQQSITNYVKGFGLKN